MEDRRAAFPTHDAEPSYNILDGPTMPTHNDPINVVHRRYWALLAVAAVCVGLVSFYMPVSMTAALHCTEDNSGYSYEVVPSGGALSGETATPLPEEAAEALESARASHILQQDALLEEGGIVVYPDEDTNYALYAAPDGAYVFALDKGKLRYRVQDGEALYTLLAGLAQ